MGQTDMPVEFTNVFEFLDYLVEEAREAETSRGPKEFEKIVSRSFDVTKFLAAENVEKIVVRLTFQKHCSTMVAIAASYVFLQYYPDAPYDILFPPTN